MRDTTLDTLTDPFLWVRIRGAMLPVEANGRGFALQLGEITGLAPTAALALEGEYRRCLYLAALTSAPREPLGLLRKAWEHHASFEGYLYDFCPWGLERHLPAGPITKITAPAYAATRIDYAAEFRTPPPEPYWPMPETRLGAVDTRAPDTPGAPV